MNWSGKWNPCLVWLGEKGSVKLSLKRFFISSFLSVRFSYLLEKFLLLSSFYVSPQLLKMGRF